MRCYNIDMRHEKNRSRRRRWRRKRRRRRRWIRIIRRRLYIADTIGIDHRSPQAVAIIRCKRKVSSVCVSHPRSTRVESFRIEIPSRMRFINSFCACSLYEQKSISTAMMTVAQVIVLIASMQCGFVGISWVWGIVGSTEMRVVPTPLCPCPIVSECTATQRWLMRHGAATCCDVQIGTVHHTDRVGPCGHRHREISRTFLGTSSRDE